MAAQNEENKSLQDIIVEQKKTIHSLSNIIDELPGSIYWKDKNGVYLGHNNFAREKMKSLGLHWESIVGKTDYDLFSKEVADQYRRHDLETMNSGTVCTDEERLTLESGEELVQLSYKKPLRNEQGEIFGVVGNTTDITYLKRMETELLEAKEYAEAVNQSKIDLIRNMENDIRTPFNGIWSLASVLEEKESDPYKKQCLRNISESAKALLKYCNSVLEFIKADINHAPILSKKFDLKQLVSEVMTMEAVTAKSKQLELSLEYEKNVPEIVIGDPGRIQRLLLNLTSNALKFTHVGYVRIRVELADQQDKDVYLYLIIEDSGIGVPEEYQHYLYGKYNKHTQDSTGFKGFGLGISIIKQLMHDLEGELDVKSEPGKGTKFICTLPFRIPLVNSMLYTS